jgi:hypothetical protein
MLQLFYLDVAKVDRGMLQMFQMHVASVCSKYFICFQTYVVIVFYQYCRVPKTRGTHNQRLKKTKLTGLAETANETPRQCSDSYEARSTGRLDHVPTRTRLARRNASTTEKSPTRMTQGRAGRPTSFTNSGTKVRAFNTNCQPLPTLMAAAVTSMEAVPVSNLTFYCPSRDGR